MNRLASCFFLAALACFTAFHFTFFQRPVGGVSEFIGWEIWIAIFEILQSITHSDWEDRIASAAFATSAMLIVSSPWLVPVFKRSRLVWWLGVLSSGSAVLGFGSVLLPSVVGNSEMRVGLGFIYLFSAMGLNLLGYLMIRREAPIPPQVDSSC